MPRAFTEQEQEQIHDRLLEVGGELFARYGLKKTNIGDLTEPLGIAKSSFYRFYDSKEALYAELLMRRFPAMIDRLMAVSFEATDDIREAIVRYLKALVDLIETDELARTLLVEPQTVAQLMAKQNFKDLQEQSGPLLEPLYRVFREAQSAGKMVEDDPQVLVQVLELITVLPLYKQGIDPAKYPALLDTVTRVIADGLTCPARRNHR
ncbi:TetR/AcrR family transcriptional regulator [Candidatus Bipolaricaulota bacterium]|nr:TetR/AcrR family transcriptional regulator [Candidatus Bipolaricaulota bacterium]